MFTGTLRHTTRRATPSLQSPRLNITSTVNQSTATETTQTLSSNIEQHHTDLNLSKPYVDVSFSVLPTGTTTNTTTAVPRTTTTLSSPHTHSLNSTNSQSPSHTTLKSSRLNPFTWSTRYYSNNTNRTPPIKHITTTITTTPHPHKPTTSSTHTTKHSSPHTISTRKLRFDAKKWEKDYDPKQPLDGLPRDPYFKPNKKSTLDPTFDPGREQRKHDHIQRLRWQLREGVWLDDALPKTRDQNDPLKPFIPQIPMMEDTPFRMQRPTPIWDSFKETPKLKDFINHYIPTKVKVRRTKALFKEYLKGPLDVLDPKYKRFVNRFFGIKSIILYGAIGLFTIYTFEMKLLLNTELEEMFEITAKNLLRSESFLVTANTIQEMVNTGLLDPSLSVLETKIFLEETLNVGYAYNSQVLKDLSYLMDGFHKAIELEYPDKENPNSVMHIDHFSQTDTDISYLPLDRYLTSFERFLEVYYTKDIDMVSLATHEPYNPQITSPRQVFMREMKNKWDIMIFPLVKLKHDFISYFDLLPAMVNSEISAITRESDDEDVYNINHERIKRYNRGNDNVHGSNGTNQNSPLSLPPSNFTNDALAHNSIQKRIRNADLHNIDFSQSVTLQFNPNIGQVVDFYFDEIPSQFSFSPHVYRELLNPSDTALRRREQFIMAKLSGQRLIENEHGNPLLTKEPNISFNSDHKHRFLTESFLPTHLHAFKRAYMQTRSIHNVEQLVKEAQAISIRAPMASPAAQASSERVNNEFLVKAGKAELDVAQTQKNIKRLQKQGIRIPQNEKDNDPNWVENNTIAALYKHHGQVESSQNHAEMMKNLDYLQRGEIPPDVPVNSALYLKFRNYQKYYNLLDNPDAAQSHVDPTLPIWLSPPPNYKPSLFNGYGLYYKLNNISTDYYYNHDSYRYIYDPNDSYLNSIGKTLYNSSLGLMDYGIDGGYKAYQGLYNGLGYVLGSVVPSMVDQFTTNVAPMVRDTLLTDQIYLEQQRKEDQMKQYLEDVIKSGDITNSTTNQIILPNDSTPLQPHQQPATPAKFYNPLSWLTSNRIAQERNKLLLLNATNLTLTQRLEKLANNSINFDYKDFNEAYSSFAQQDYLDMLLRFNDMLLQMRGLLSKLAKENNLYIDDFRPDYGNIKPQLNHTPYLYAYYNRALRDLGPMVNENVYLPLLPVMYQYNDLENKGVRCLTQRLNKVEKFRLGQFYREQTLKDLMGLRDLGNQRMQLEDEEGNIDGQLVAPPKTISSQSHSSQKMSDFVKRLLLDDDGTNHNDNNEWHVSKDIKDLFLFERGSYGSKNHHNAQDKRRPIYVLDSVINRFEDGSDEDPELLTKLGLDTDDTGNKTTHMKRHQLNLVNHIGQVVTKLDLCLLQTYAELERYKSVFDATLPPYIHVNTDLLLQDERFAFDLIHQQEEQVRLQRLKAYAPHVGKTVDWFSRQEQFHSPQAQQPPLRPDEINKKR